jgi:flavodoxin
MKILIIYDSIFGNTQQIAQVMGRSFDAQEEVVTLRVSDVKLDQLMGLGLLIVGSPTRAFKPTPAVSSFLKWLPADSINGIKVAAFDTRISANDNPSWILKFFVKIFGYAAKPIADGLTKKGGDLALPPEGFYVKDSEGPLREGELERAANWAKAIQKKVTITPN